MHLPAVLSESYHYSEIKQEVYEPSSSPQEVDIPDDEKLPSDEIVYHHTEISLVESEEKEGQADVVEEWEAVETTVLEENITLKDTAYGETVSESDKQEWKNRPHEIVETYEYSREKIIQDETNIFMKTSLTEAWEKEYREKELIDDKQEVEEFERMESMVLQQEETQDELEITHLESSPSAAKLEDHTQMSDKIFEEGVIESAFSEMRGEPLQMHLIEIEKEIIEQEGRDDKLPTGESQDEENETLELGEQTELPNASETESDGMETEGIVYEDKAPYEYGDDSQEQHHDITEEESNILEGHAQIEAQPTVEDEGVEIEYEEQDSKVADEIQYEEQLSQPEEDKESPRDYDLQYSDKKEELESYSKYDNRGDLNVQPELDLPADFPQEEIAGKEEERDVRQYDVVDEDVESGDEGLPESEEGGEERELGVEPTIGDEKVKQSQVSEDVLESDINVTEAKEDHPIAQEDLNVSISSEGEGEMKDVSGLEETCMEELKSQAAQEVMFQQYDGLAHGESVDQREEEQLEDNITEAQPKTKDTEDEAHIIFEQATGKEFLEGQQEEDEIRDREDFVKQDEHLAVSLSEERDTVQVVSSYDTVVFPEKGAADQVRRDSEPEDDQNLSTDEPVSVATAAEQTQHSIGTEDTAQAEDDATLAARMYQPPPFPVEEREGEPPEDEFTQDQSYSTEETTEESFLQERKEEEIVTIYEQKEHASETHDGLLEQDKLLAESDDDLMKSSLDKDSVDMSNMEAEVIEVIEGASDLDDFETQGYNFTETVEERTTERSEEFETYSRETAESDVKISQGKEDLEGLEAFQDQGVPAHIDEKDVQQISEDLEEDEEKEFIPGDDSAVDPEFAVDRRFSDVKVDELDFDQVKERFGFEEPEEIQESSGAAITTEHVQDLEEEIPDEVHKEQSYKEDDFTLKAHAPLYPSSSTECQGPSATPSEEEAPMMNDLGESVPEDLDQERIKGEEIERPLSPSDYTLEADSEQGSTILTGSELDLEPLGRMSADTSQQIFIEQSIAATRGALTPDSREEHVDGRSDVSSESRERDFEDERPMSPSEFTLIQSHEQEELAQALGISSSGEETMQQSSGSELDKAMNVLDQASLMSSIYEENLFAPIQPTQVRESGMVIVYPIVRFKCVTLDVN